MHFCYDWQHRAYRHRTQEEVLQRELDGDFFLCAITAIITGASLLLFTMMTVKMAVWVLNLLPVTVIRLSSVEVNPPAVEDSDRLCVSAGVRRRTRSMSHLIWSFRLYTIGT